MRRTIILGTLIAMFGVAAVAQARDSAETGNDRSIDAAQPGTPAVRSDHGVTLERHTEHREIKDDRRQRCNLHHDEASEDDDAPRHHGQHH